MIRTIEYDGHNSALVQVMQLFETLGGRFVESGVRKNSIDRSIEELNNGQYHVAKDGKDLIKQCLG